MLLIIFQVSGDYLNIPTDMKYFCISERLIIFRNIVIRKRKFLLAKHLKLLDAISEAVKKFPDKYFRCKKTDF